MTLTKIATLALPLVLAGVSTASAGSSNGPAALALAGVVAPYSPSLSLNDKKIIAAFLAGKTDGPLTGTITVTADKIVCRISNVDIAARSCELTFGNTVRKIQGREANELYATEAAAGVPSDGAAGSIIAHLSKLNCALDPAKIKDKAGAGADCSYEAAK